MDRLGRGLAVAVAGTLLLAASADAATLRGTVVAPPAVHGTHAVVPVLAAGRAVKVVVATSGLRGPNGALRADALRFGDRVVASGTAPRGMRPHARSVRVVKRGAAPSFASLTKRRASAVADTEQALADITAVQQSGGTTGASPADVRAKLMALRTEINLLVAGLRSEADALDAAVAAATPAARGTTYLAVLSDAAAKARSTADALDGQVAKLDQSIIDVGGSSAPSVPISTVGTVWDVLHPLLDLLRGL